MSRSSLVAVLGLLTAGYGLMFAPAGLAGGVYLNVPITHPERPANLPDDYLTQPAPRIVLGQSIAGVKLGESEAQVTATLGAPAYKMPEGQNTSWGYPKGLEGRIGFDHSAHVNSMWTLSRHQKTNKGIGPGSSLKQLRKAYPAVKCATGPFGPTSLICVLKSRHGGRTVETTFPFFTRSAGVREVEIGLG
jgi:hypothetical protein